MSDELEKAVQATAQQISAYNAVADLAKAEQHLFEAEQKFKSTVIDESRMRIERAIRDMRGRIVKIAEDIKKTYGC